MSSWIWYLRIVVLNAVAYVYVVEGSQQCLGRSTLWINPTLCTSSAAGMSSNSRILPNYEAVYEFVVTDDDAHDNANSMLVNNAQCNDRTPLWISPSLCADSATELSKCSTSKILAPKYDFVFDSMEDEEAMKSMLTNFMTLASLTRDVEMQKDKELCDASNESMPWDIHMCDGDIKLVHRTQPILGHSEYNFETNNSNMAGKKKNKSKFGLPREKAPSTPIGVTNSVMAPSIRMSRIILSQGIVDAHE